MAMIHGAPQLVAQLRWVSCLWVLVAPAGSAKVMSSERLADFGKWLNQRE
jgi:hypothetical protein